MRLTRILCLLLLCAGAVAATDSNRIILRVNDRIATLYDYEVRHADRLRAIQQADLEPEERAELIAGAGAEVLTNMMEEMLVLSRADQIDYRPSGAEIDQAVIGARQNFGIETDEQFEAALMQNGMTREGFRQQIETNMRISGVLGREVQQRIELAEEDLRRYYYAHEEEFTTGERLRLSDVVVLEDAVPSADRRAEIAAGIAAEIAAGATFSEVVEVYESQGSTSGVVEIGWVERGDLDSALENAVWDLEAGQVSQPVEGRGGLHILLVEERQAAEMLPFSEVSGQIQSIERQRIIAQEYDGYMRELREAAYIAVLDLPDDAQGFDVERSASRLVFESPEGFLPGASDDAEVSSGGDNGSR